MPQHVWILYTDTYRYPPALLREALGAIPDLLVPDDPRSAIEQFRERYIGGWDPLPGAVLLDGTALKYPGDPPMYPYAGVQIGLDLVMVYPYSWVVVKFPDHTFEVARLD